MANTLKDVLQKQYEQATKGPDIGKQYTQSAKLVFTADTKDLLASINSASKYFDSVTKKHGDLTKNFRQEYKKITGNYINQIDKMKKGIIDTEKSMAASDRRQNGLLTMREDHQKRYNEEIAKTLSAQADMKKYLDAELERESKILRISHGKSFESTVYYKTMKENYDVLVLALEKETKAEQEKLSVRKKQIDVINTEIKKEYESQSRSKDKLDRYTKGLEKNKEMLDSTNKKWQESGALTSKFTGAINNAVKLGNVPALVQISKLIEKEKDMQSIVKDLDGWKKELSAIQSKDVIDKEDFDRLQVLPGKIQDSEEKLKDLASEINKVNQGMMGKGWDKLKDMASSKWTTFAAAGTSLGFFANALRNVDMASKFTAQSLQNQPIDEVSAQYKEFKSELEDSDSTMLRFIGNLKSSYNTQVGLAGQTKKSVDIQQQLRFMTLETGKSFEELSDTAVSVMQKFHLTVKDNSKSITDITRNVSLFGEALGIGSEAALDFSEKSVKSLGTSLEGATLNMAAMAKGSSQLHKEFKDLKMSNADFTKSVLNSIDADTRSSQNIGLKTQLMRNQIAIMLKMGKTEEEARKSAENAAKTAVEGSEAAMNMSGMAMAEKIKNDAAELKSYEAKLKAQGVTGVQLQMQMDKKRAEVSEKYLKGIDDPEQRKKAAIRTKDILQKVNEGVYKDTYVLGKAMVEEFGSQESGMEQLYETRKKLYKSSGSAAVELLMKNESMTRDVAENTVQAWIKGLDYQQFAHKKVMATASEDLDNTKTLAKAVEDSVNSAKMKLKSSPITPLIESIKGLINDPIVSTGLGVASGAAALFGAFKIMKSLNKVGGISDGDRLIVQAIQGSGTGGSGGGLLGDIGKGDKGGFLSKMLAKIPGGKLIGKALPFAGKALGAGALAYGAYDMYNKYSSGKGVGLGDIAQTALSGAGLIPGVGTAISLGGSALLQATGADEMLNKYKLGGTIPTAALPTTSIAKSTNVMAPTKPASAQAGTAPGVVNAQAKGMNTDGSGMITLRIADMASLLNQNMRNNFNAGY